MKTYKLLILFVLQLGVSCIQQDEYSIPEAIINEPEINGNIVEIQAVLGILAQAQASGETEFTFSPDNTDYMQGYVVSSDEAGNFFEELIVQDKPENPTAGIKILIDENPLFTSFELGRKVFVKLAGLTVATTNGVSGLGIGGSSFIQKIPAPLLDLTIVRSSEIEATAPLEVELTDFSDAYENLFIRLNNVQFNRFDVLGETPKTFASEPGDEFDGERFLESCEGGGVVVSTSTFSDFKSLLLPAGRGSLDGILSRDFFDDYYVINIIDPSNISFGEVAERCDPEFTSCDTPSGGGTNVFSENFEDVGNIVDLEAAGWTIVNTAGGTTLWELGNFSGNQYTQITAFGSGEDVIESWLISPEINMDSQSHEELLFKIQASFDNGTALSVFFAYDFSGDPTVANWNLLDAAIPTGPAATFGAFEEVGPINVSCLEGNVHFAFLYTGSASGISTRYHLDDVEVKGL